MSQPYDVPLFGDPDPPKVQRVESHKDRDDALQIKYIRYKVSGVVCYEYHLRPADAPRCGPAAWLRINGPDQRALCYQHKAEYLARENQ